MGLVALVPCLGAAGGRAPSPGLLGTEPDDTAASLPRAAVAETPVVATGVYVHPFGGVAVGRGLRFNNPYRLQTQLGERGESLSLSATYLDLSAGVTFGDPSGLQHGMVTHYSEALGGIAQSVIGPGYVAAMQLGPRWLVLGRLGLPIVVRPDTTAGLEAAVGGVCFITAGTGVTGELIGSLFYGAATNEVAVTYIPLLSVQLGGFVRYEVLP